MLGGGVVVTGGASAMEGVPELAEQIFEMPVRRGVPGGVSGLKENVLDPRFATGVGLILYARDEERPAGRPESGLVGRVAAPFARWFSEFF
jgi:cell division protein FtsA